MFGGNKSHLSVSYRSAEPFALIEGAAMGWDRALFFKRGSPVGPDKIAQAIKSTAPVGLALKEELSPAEVDAYVQGTVGKSAESLK